MEKNKFRKAVVMFHDEKAGVVEEIADGFRFTYDSEFIKKNKPISVSLPTTKKVYESINLFPFFLGLLPEGWYLDIAAKKLKIDTSDSFGFLLATCRETIGAVAIVEEME